jgi:hypothetical protein
MSNTRDREWDKHVKEVHDVKQQEIDDLVQPPTQPNPYVPTIETRLKWAHDYFDRNDFASAVSEVDKILAANATDPQRTEAARLRGSAERAASKFGDEYITPPPVEPTWR